MPQPLLALQARGVDTRGNALARQQIQDSQSRNALAGRQLGVAEQRNALAGRSTDIAGRRLALDESKDTRAQGEAQRAQMAQEGAAITAAFLSAPPEMQAANYPKMIELGKAFGVDLPPELNDQALFTMRQAVNRVASSGDLQKQAFPESDVLSPERFQQNLTLKQAGKAEGTTVNVGPQGQDFGDPPKDFVWARNPDGSVALRADPETGFRSPVAIPIAGGPVARKIEAGEEQAAGKLQQREQKTAIVTEDIDRILGVVENSTIPVTGVGSLLSFVPDTNAKDVASMLDTIKAVTGFDQLNQMRANSPTGGALGQVSELENRLLQAALGSLQQDQSKDQFIFNLKRVKEAYLDALHGTGNRPRGGVGIPDATGDDLSALDDDALINLELTPENAEAFVQEMKRRGF